MNANKARTRSANVRLNALLAEIEKASGKGRTSILVDVVDFETKKELRNLGYYVACRLVKNEYYTLDSMDEIIWEL